MAKLAGNQQVHPNRSLKNSEAKSLYPCGKLRSVVFADLDDLRRWRNHPRVRRAMITQHEISQQEHFAWWEKIRSDDTKRWCIYTEKDVSEAVVYFFRLDQVEKTGWWGFYLCDYSEATRSSRGELARRVVGSVIEYAFKEMDLGLLLCEVRESNVAAISLYKHFNFVESSATPSRRGIPLIVLELKRP